MKIMRAIERADALCLNPYSLEEKLCWCDEVSAELRRKVIKIYDVISTKVNDFGDVELPDGIPFDRVEVIWVGKKLMKKQDFRSFFLSDKNLLSSSTQTLKAVYLTIPKPIRFIEIKGEFNTSENVIEMENPPFIEGDMIEISQTNNLTDEPDWENSIRTYVLEANDDKIIIDSNDIEPQTDAPLAIRRVITDSTEIDEAPYDSMYIEYILAKMALYQHDYVGYNAHMTQYNSLFEDFRREYKSRNPLSEITRIKNYSIV